MGNLLLKNPSKNPMTKLHFAKVTRFYASSNTADVVTIDDNVSLLGCQILCPFPAGFSFGVRYIPSHNDSNRETEYVMSPGDIYCVAAFVENEYYNAAILGFLFPKESTLAIPDYGLYLFRHESDVMWMVRGDGTVQIYHPSGSIFKISENETNEMTDDVMTPSKADGLYIREASDYNNSKLSNLFINWYKGQKVKLDSDGNIIIKTTDISSGANKSVITLTPDGVVTIETENEINAITKDVNVVASGNVSVSVDGTVGVNAQNDVNISSDSKIALTAPVIQMIKS